MRDSKTNKAESRQPIIQKLFAEYWITHTDKNGFGSILGWKKILNKIRLILVEKSTKIK